MEKFSLKFQLLRLSEVQVFLFGIGLAFIYITWLIADNPWSPADGKILLEMTAVHIFIGRAAAMLFGYAQGLKSRLVIPVNMFVDTLMVLLYYPFFAFSCQYFLSKKLFHALIYRCRIAAESKQDFVRKYGLIGLFLFVFSPVWMTGPLVGCAIGYLLGIGPWVIILVVLSATFCTTLVWGIFLPELHKQVTSHSDSVPIILVLFLILVALLAGMIQKYLKSTKVAGNFREK